ncbi:guanylate kinase [Eikenella sp. NML080894]|uniref:Guanylate kinase n=1 Tax=Eikenella exigua TaxID=2528037 RepID=A0AAX1F8N8_9NEIS|nr:MULTISPECIES: guanylate kinase [Eikenella]OAM25863.1 guanylate kinase [Eikenella sp. NML01-A-086]OAM35840.1 guanylate kinase [Eikenella sp. NML080894]OAM43529.1 guanylate kinase [Eikenella sp. NML97-A-109]OAM45000.1 guanylate kinase [Eikenella sp. NML99-0057]QED92324.1 guanylate kinase [Eikenella exigua]
MQGNIFVISAASGTGKTTLIARLLQHHSDIRVSISHTTRAPRRGEENGKHYHFVSVPEFERMIEEGRFVEYAKVYGNYYGTSTQSLESLTRQGTDVILEIDTQGAEQIRRQLPQAYSIFIAPPSLGTLEQRLRQRAADAPQVIAVRLAEARNEIEQARLFDYLVINDDLTAAEAALLHIIKSQRFHLENQTPFLTKLLGGSENA